MAAAKNKAVVVVLQSKFRNLSRPIRKITEHLMKITGIKAGYCEVYLVGSDVMHKNVLAFPEPAGFPRPDIKKGLKMLGEIYLNPDYIHKEQLEIAGDKLAYMLIHGFLHILGYDHMKKDDRLVMEKREQQLLKQIHDQFYRRP